MTNKPAHFPPADQNEPHCASEDSLVARLSRRGPESLARFILTLAYDDNGIGEYVRAFIEGDNVLSCAAVVRSSIDRILDGERPYDRRHALDAVFLRRLDHVLDMIEFVILPAAPARACMLLNRVIEAQDEIGDHVPEADTRLTFARAHELLRRGTTTLPVENG